MFWITIDQIQCFQEVINQGSFTKASDKLNKAKSAVMYSVKKLEEQLGFELLNRTGYRPELTQKGEAFFIKSQKILLELKELHEQTKLIATDVEMRLRISASGIFDVSLLYPVLEKAMKNFPSTEILFEREMLSGEKMLRRNQVDLAILENLNNKRDFDYKVISKTELLLVIAQDHEFSKLPKKEQTKEKIYRYPQVIQRSTIRDDDFQVGVHEESLKWKVTDTPSKKEIIMSRLGWGRLPSFLVEKEIKMKELSHLSHFNDDDVVEMYLCKEKGRKMGKVAQFIWDSF